MEEYVKPDYTPPASKDDSSVVLTPEIEAKILSLNAIKRSVEGPVRNVTKAGVITPEAVQRGLGISGLSEKDAERLLEAMRAKGALKTKAERIAELAPKTVGVIEELPLEK